MGMDESVACVDYGCWHHDIQRVCCWCCEPRQVSSACFDPSLCFSIHLSFYLHVGLLLSDLDQLGVEWLLDVAKQRELCN
jgi:hypothetical protein